MKTPGSAQGAAPARTRTFLRRLLVFVVAAAFAVFGASALAGSFAMRGAFVLSGSITTTDPVVTNMKFDSGVSAECGAPQSGAGTALGTFHYEVYTFRNISGATRCVNVSIANSISSGSAVRVAAYPGSFDPSDPSTNYRGNTNANAGFDNGLSFDVDCGFCGPDFQSTFNVVAWETTPNGGATYTLLVEGIGVIMTGGGPTATASLHSFRASSAPKGVLVRWKTRSEHKALGFNLYRGNVKKIRLTRSMVRAFGDGRGHSYSYLDRSARSKPGPYYLEVVQRSGSKIMFGPAAR